MRFTHQLRGTQATSSPAAGAETAGPESLPAALAETHVSVVVFLGSRVYKLKKPVTTGFLDFSSREARHAVCHREVELNRRLAPDVYLGVADVTGPDGQLSDHLVVMRRMPEARRLSTLVAAGADVDDDVRRVARAVASFHARCSTSPEIAEAGRRDAVRANWVANFEQMRQFLGTVLDPQVAARIEVLAHRYLDGREPLFRHRIEAGLVRDGHGDLLADDVFCLSDGPRILDCIEFDDRLRHGDVLADVAFLAMDLERLGAPALARRFLAWYGELSGEHHPASLAHHYLAYRAHVRAKVACLRHGQGDPEAAEAARQTLAISRDHLERGRVRLVLVGGLPGTGKSTLAAALADARQWTVLRSDEVRKDLAGIPYHQPAAAPYGEGLYRPQFTDATYGEMLSRARRALTLGEPVVLDASWTSRRWRAAAHRVAEATAGELVELRCVAPREVAAARLLQRSRAGGDPSDSTPEVAEAMAAVADPWPSAVVVDTGDALAPALEAALGVLGGPGTEPGAGSRVGSGAGSETDGSR